MVIAGVAVATYLAGSTPSDYSLERTEVGPLVWRGSVPSVYTVGQTVLKAPEDMISVTFEHEPARRGEVDILVAIDTPQELPAAAADILWSIAFAFLSLLNLRLGDHLIPSAPLQVSCRLPSGREFSNAVQVLVEKRDEVPPDAIQGVSKEFFNLVRRGDGNVQTALELYAAHLSESSTKTRFLLLVMAIEALTNATPKHPAALALLDRWQVELDSERQGFERLRRNVLPSMPSNASCFSDVMIRFGVRCGISWFAWRLRIQFVLEI